MNDELTVRTNERDVVGDTTIVDWENSRVIVIGPGEDGNEEEAIPLADVNGIVPGRPEDFDDDPKIATDGGQVNPISPDYCNEEYCGGIYVLDRTTVDDDTVRYECSDRDCDSFRLADGDAARRQLGADTLEELRS